MADPAGFPVSTVGVDFVQSIITLTAGQIAGTDPIVAANPNRRAIKFGGATQTIKISLAPGAANGISYAASFRDGDSGSDCPKGALYLAMSQGLMAGGAIVVWEA
jgi:hypothetical protein